MSKTMFRLKNVANTATYFTGKLTVAPTVALIDTTVAAGQATLALTKGIGQAAMHIIKAPLSGVVRGNKIYKDRFAVAHQLRVDRNKKLASGEYVESIIPSDEVEYVKVVHTPHNV